MTRIKHTNVNVQNNSIGQVRHIKHPFNQQNKLNGDIYCSGSYQMGRERKCGVENKACEAMSVFTSVRCPTGWLGFSPRSLVLGSPGLRSF